MADDGIVGVPRRVEDSDAWLLELHQPGEFGTAHRRHHDVAEQQMDLLPVGAQNPQRLVAMAGFEHMVAVAFEDRTGHGSHLRLILGQQNRLGARKPNVRGRDCALAFGLGRAREVDLERRAVHRLAIHLDGSAALSDDPVDGGQAQASTLAAALGREERLEDLCAGLRVHPHPGVAHRQHHMRTRRRAPVLPDVRLVEFDVGGLDGEIAALRHRVARVDRQVHDDLFELARVGVDAVEGRIERRHQPDVLADQALQQGLGARDDLIEFQHLWLQDLLAAEGQQLLRQRRRAFAGAPHLLDVGARGVPGLEFLEHQIAVPQNGREQVVEVVRDTPGQSSDGFHLARLLELFFERTPRVLHHRPGLEILDQPPLGTLDLAPHGVERARQPADLIAASAANPPRVVAHRDGFGGMCERCQRCGDLRGKQRHKGHGTPNEHEGDKEDLSEKRCGRGHDGLAWKLDPDTPRRSGDLTNGADASGAVGCFVHVRAARAGRHRRGRDQARQIRPDAVADAADQHTRAASNQTVEDVSSRRQRHRPPQRDVAKRGGRARHHFETLGEHLVPCGLQETYCRRRRRRR